MGTSCVVLGASGFSGAELLRLLAAHPTLTVGAISGDRNAGKDVSAVHPHLFPGSPLVTLDEAFVYPAEVCFSCLPHGTGRSLLAGAEFELIVDLAEDHRHAQGWTYGLPELDRESLGAAARVANPGCYPTASLLALVPFARAGLISGAIAIDALSGYSGAGRLSEDRLLFASADAGAAAYGSIPHRHVAEIEAGLSLFGGLDLIVSFTPHLVPMSRGVLVTARAPLSTELDSADAVEVLRDHYRDEPFVRVLDEWPGTKAVLGSNSAHVSAHVDERAGLLICSAAIDNLGKGAAGQAVQNSNICLGLDEDLGLSNLGVWP
jgi:N-acetyl-gamma-glutamyl-phosphate reductase